MVTETTNQSYTFQPFAKYRRGKSAPSLSRNSAANIQVKISLNCCRMSTYSEDMSSGARPRAMRTIFSTMQSMMKFSNSGLVVSLYSDICQS